MAQAVSVMRWDDTSAPDVGDGKPSDYMTVLKKCLVDGYGATAGLNWIVVVDEILTTTPLLVLKNDVALGGSGGFIVFKADDDAGGTSVEVQSCQAFIDRDTLTNPGGYFLFHRLTTTTQKLDRWMLIGTETGFYFFVTSESKINDAVNTMGTVTSIFFWVGDFQSFSLNDPATFITMNGVHNATTFNWTASLNYKIAYATAYDVSNIYALDNSTFDSYGVSCALGQTFSPSAVVADEPEITLMFECYLKLGDSANPILSDLARVEMPYLRGKIPGLFMSAEVGFYNNAMPFIKEIGGVNYFNIPSSHSYSSMGWINLEEW